MFFFIFTIDIDGPVFVLFYFKTNFINKEQCMCNQFDSPFSSHRTVFKPSIINKTTKM